MLYCATQTHCQEGPAMRKLALILFFAALPSLPLGLIGSAQKSQANKFPHAIERSRDAARILPLLSVVPEDGVPRELLDKAAAVGVFPRVERETMYFTHMIRGYGVISARNE